MTYDARFEAVEDYMQSYPEADIGPWESAGTNGELAELLAQLSGLGVDRVEVEHECEDFAEVIRIFTPVYQGFNTEQVAYIMTNLSGDEAGHGLDLESGCEYIDIWWD